MYCENQYGQFRAHILDLYFVRLSNAAPFPFCENYGKLHDVAKHLEKGLNKGDGEIFGALFSKKKVSFFHNKVLFLANI